MRTILATDFSPCSRAATRHAAQVASLWRDSLLLVHVVHTPPAGSAHMRVALAPTQTELMRQAERDIALEIAELSHTGVEAGSLILVGPPGPSIVDVARRDPTRMVVMGTHGRRGASHLLFGSVAEQVAETAPCPVMVVPEVQAPGTALRTEGPSRVVASVDPGRGGDAVLDWLASLRQMVPSDVTFVRGYAPDDEGARYGIAERWLASEGHPALVALLERDLRARIGELSGRGATSCQFFAHHRGAPDPLIGATQLLAPDLLVVAQRSQGRGSWAASSLREARVPVVIVPMNAAQPRRAHIPETRSLLIATDLSDLANAAIPRAYSVLRRGGVIDLCHVHESGPGSARMADESGEPPLDAEARDEVEQRLRQLVPAQAEALGINTRIWVVEARGAAEAIVQTAERLGVDMIALATHGRTGLPRVLLGSVAETVVRTSGKPVLVIRLDVG